MSFFAPIGSYSSCSSSFTVHGSVQPPPSTRPSAIPQPIIPAIRYTIPPPSPPYWESPAERHEEPAPYIASPPPPSYAAPSLPGYRPLPQSAEAILLLAPPPRYCHCTCDAEGQLHTHSGCEAREARAGDVVVAMLIALNVIVWAGVIWGFCKEGTPIPMPGYEGGDVL